MEKRTYSKKYGEVPIRRAASDNKIMLKKKRGSVGREC
jgi:hypothetical protein